MRNQALNNSLSLFASAVFLEFLPVHLADYQFLGFNGSVNTLFNAHDTLLRNEPRKEMLADKRFSLPLLRVRITLPPEGLHGNFVSLAVVAPGQRQRRSGQHFVPDLDQHIVAVEAVYQASVPSGCSTSKSGLSEVKLTAGASGSRSGMPTSTTVPRRIA